jgi:hypothetical protein
MPIDFADSAQDLQELLLKRTLENQSQKTSAAFSGFCLSCEEPIENRRFCDSDCREDFENKHKK